MHPTFGPPAAVLRSAGRPALVLLALVSLTACSGQNTAMPMPAPTATVTVTAPPRSGIALTTATLTAKPTATGEQLQQSASQLLARAKGMDLAEVKTTINGNTITVTAPGDARDKLTALARPGQLRLRPVLALAPCLKSLPTPIAPGATASAAALTSAPSAAAPDLTAAFTQGIVPPELMGAWTALDCSAATARRDYQQAATMPSLACSTKASQDTWDKFVLGPVGVDGTDITGAKAELDELNGSGWQVRLTFNSTGATAFTDLTGRLGIQQHPANQFAIVVDGSVVSHPLVRGAIPGGTTFIGGSLAREEAEQLASTLTHPFPVELTLSNLTLLPHSGGTP